MIICTFLLLPLYVLLLVVIPILTQVVQTICSWVSTVLQVVTQVLSQVCSWLPWPLNQVCNWVTQTVTWLQTVWDYVCNTIIQTIITLVTHVVSVLTYVTHVVCILVNVIVGLPGFLLCILRVSPPKKLRLCVKVLTDELGHSAVTGAAIKANVARMISSYERCGVRVLVVGIEYIVKPQYLSTTTSSASGLLSAWHVWFTQRACWCCSQVTVFVVDQIVGAGGVTYWGDPWCRVDVDCNTDDTIMAHEVGHLLNLWHDNSPNNVMYPTYSATAHDFTPFQCCVMRRSPFLTYL